MTKTCEDIEKIRENLDQKGYHIAFGTAVQSSDSLNMRELIKEAENSMYSAKQAFYRHPANNRRDR